MWQFTIHYYTILNYLDLRVKANVKASKEKAHASQQIHMKILERKILVIRKNPSAAETDPIFSMRLAALG